METCSQQTRIELAHLAKYWKMIQYGKEDLKPGVLDKVNKTLKLLLNHS